MKATSSIGGTKKEAIAEIKEYKGAIKLHTITITITIEDSDYDVDDSMFGQASGSDLELQPTVEVDTLREIDEIRRSRSDFDFRESKSTNTKF